MEFNRQSFFDGYREHFGKLSQSQVSGLESLLAFIEDDTEWTDIRHIAYLMATIFHECDQKWQPILEYATGNAYEGRQDLGNIYPGDGPRFKGRGYVQITGRANYKRFTPIVGKDLVAAPDRALDPAISYKIASEGMRRGLFAGRRLSTYIFNDFCDYIEARRIINRLDRAELIAGHAAKFEAILRAAEVKASTSSPSPQTLATEPQSATAGHSDERGGLLARILRFFRFR